MVLTASFVLSPVTGLVCHRHQRILAVSVRSDRHASANLTPASGRQDHTTSPSAAIVSRQRALCRSRIQKNPPCNLFARKTLPRPSHPVPYVRDDRDTPLSWDGMAESINLFLPNGEAEYFCKEGWTVESTNCPSGKSPASSSRTRGPQRERNCAHRDAVPYRFAQRSRPSVPTSAGGYGSLLSQERPSTVACTEVLPRPFRPRGLRRSGFG